MTPIRPSRLAPALMLLAAACAAGPGGPGGPPPPRGPQAFVSPFGEPFTAAPDDAYPVAAWFAGADTDHDGALTREEFAADGMRYFAVLDRARDGEIGPDDVAFYEQSIGGALAHANSPGGGGGGRPAGGPPPPRAPGGLGLGGAQQDPNSGFDPSSTGARSRRSGPLVEATTTIARAGLLAVPQPVKSADTNFNQYITRAEWAAVAERWFGLLDQDRDGRLTLAELPHTALQRGEPVRTPRAPRRL